MTEEAYRWRSLGDVAGVRPSREPGRHLRKELWEFIHQQNLGMLRKLNRQRGLEIFVQGRMPAESREGHSRPELRLGGYFIPNTSPPTFEFELRMKYREVFYSRSCPLEFRARPPSEILTFNVRMPESFSNWCDPKRLFEISAGVQS